MSETETVIETIETALPTPTLREKIRELLTAAAEPLKLAALKKALKLAGVPFTGKKKVTDEELQQALESELQDRHAFEHAGKKYSAKAPLTAEEQIEQVMRAKIAALGDELFTDAKLGKPKPTETEEKQKAFATVLQKLLAEKVLYAYGAKFGKQAPPTAEEQIEKLMRAKIAALGDEPVADAKLGKPKPTESEEKQRAFATVLQKMLVEKVLYAHGKKFGKHAPRLPEWYDTEPNKKPFATLLTAARKIVEQGATTTEVLLSILQEKLREAVVPKTPAAVLPKPEPAPTPPTPPVIGLRTALRDAYEHLCDFIEFQDRLVEIPRLFTETSKRMPGLTIADFHQEIEALNKEWVVELHELNEVKDAKNRQYAIERDDRLYYFLRWK